MLSSRPVTSTRSPLTRTKRWTSCMKRSMSKKVPSKTKAKGMVGNPADPTVAPGGSVAAAAWVAGGGLLVEGVALEDELLEDDESDDDELDDDELLDDAPPVDPLAGVVGAA